MAAPREQKFFISPRILVREITRTGINASYLEEEAYNTPVVINIIEKNNDKDRIKVLLAAINSKLFYFFHLNNNPKAKAITSIPKILVDDVRNIPVTKSLFSNEDLPSLVDEIIKLTQQLHVLINSCNSFIKDNYGLKVSVLEKGWNFLHQSIKLSISEQEQLHEWYIQKLSNYEKLKKEIDLVDSKIDKEIYKAYGLEPDEIEAVERTAIPLKN